MNIKIRPKNSVKLADQLHDQLLDWIISGILKEGDKIPSENELCKSFQVSRPIVREAILKLQEEDLVATKKGIGTFVLDSPLKDLSKYVSAQDVSDILESHEVRIALEAESAALAALRRSPEQLVVIKNAQLAMRKDFEESNLSIQADYEFHIGIAQATNNDIFVQLLENLHIGLRKTMAIGQELSRERVKSKISPERNNQVLEEHQRIIDAIEIQDQEAARFAMRYHISKIKQRIMDVQTE
ncbi:FadR/GntR family transcriptional regulator [Algibacter mikhailovii]|uniref:GntR family transcriptional regulator n=1 Tax=Algibacter mikhailovii TaxID=425498 RepID=A0A918V4B5_9FLAO|nr:FadR/GntR family transcriptional regulator [Algibacter mikhailovii]GGZ69670.1 GntR family transcriptional regulator [Algibacter mikhailovii]